MLVLILYPGFYLANYIFGPLEWWNVPFAIGSGVCLWWLTVQVDNVLFRFYTRFKFKS